MLLCFFKSQVGVGYSKGALPVNNSKASDKDQYILVRPYDIKTHYTKFIEPGLYLNRMLHLHHCIYFSDLGI